MEISVLPRILALIALMALSAFFSGSEVALFSLRKSRLDQLKAKGVAVAEVASSLLARPRRLIITILIGNETVNLAASAIMASLVIHWLGEGSKWVAVLIMTPLLMIFGEITPKSVALRRPEWASQWVARPLAAFAVVVTPLRWLLRNLSEWIIRGLGGGRQTADNILSEGEFRILVDMGHEVGELEEQERKLIHNVFEFGDTLVSEIMIPRPDIFLLSYHMALPEIIEAIRANPHSRIPVYRNQPGNITGILYTKDLLHLLRGRPSPASGVRLPLREPYFVPPSKKVGDLFHDFKRKKTHIALVVDEFGDLAGLVTLDDVLEEVFGDWPAPADSNGSSDIVALPDGGYSVNARVLVEDAQKELGLSLPESPADTVGGFVMDRLGRLPNLGERIEHDGCIFTVTEIKGRRILKVRIDATPGGDGKTDGGAEE